MCEENMAMLSSLFVSDLLILCGFLGEYAEHLFHADGTRQCDIGSMESLTLFFS
jgi:hypothetical protein